MNKKKGRCLPPQFFIKCLMALFGAIIVGIGIGAATYKAPMSRLLLKANYYLPDGSKKLVPAKVTTGGTGDEFIPGADLEWPLSTDPKNLTPISRQPGTKLWLRFRWKDAEVTHIATFPRSGDLEWPVDLNEDSYSSHHN